MTTEMQRKQNRLSEHLLLLQQLNYSDLYTDRQDKLWYSDRDTREEETHHDICFLDALAMALTTGDPGDVYAAAFDKRKRFMLVLAKNDSPTEADRAAAKELISLIRSPETNDWKDLFPFLIERCRTNINRRIKKLAASVTGPTLLQDGMKTYIPNGDIRSEILGGMLRYGDEVPTFRDAWNDCIQDIINWCKTLDLASNTPANREQFKKLYLSAQVVIDSPFLKWLIDDKTVLPQESKARVGRFKRRLAKCCQYVVGIDQLIRKAKKLPPISLE